MAELEQGSESQMLADGRLLTLHWAGVTDVGRRRETNQDAFLAGYPLFVVADGMGGHAGGEIASRITIAQLRAVVESGEVETGAIEKAIQRATAEIVAQVEATDEGTGTTLTGFFLGDDDGAPAWTTLNIGDSRVYLARDGGIVQLTTDHSVVQEMIASGRLSAEEAEGHPYSNVITRAVGASEVTTPDYVLVDIRDGDVLVACSDGLTKELTDYGILHFVTTHPDPGEATAAMLAAALENGGRDNVTVIVARADVGGDIPSTDDESAE